MMKIHTAKIIVFQEDNERPIWYSDPRKAAEHWARVKSQEWVEKNKDKPEYNVRNLNTRWAHRTNILHDEGRIRYRKLKRRALPIFRKAMDINT